VPQGELDSYELDIVRVTWGLDAATVLEAYRRGEFPMGGYRVITWHRPKQRAVLPLEGFHISRSLARTLKQGRFEVTVNCDFAGVMRGCAARQETWIDDRILRVYGELHRVGHAHSVEVWVDGALAGGVYGVQIGGAFFAESKFHRVRDMSKVALAKLVERLWERGFALLEVQYLTPHLAQFGVVQIPHAEYVARLQAAIGLERRFD
jgi:leucyl/phenylalanyl-tRNA--protein transferase